jgi:hypothetical protein
MGAPESGLEAAEQPTAETLLTTLRTIKDPERVKHVAVLDYWLSIRGGKEFPPLHDLDPLEISDAAPSSILFELIGGGQDAEIRHLGDALKDDVTVKRIIDASSPSLLSSIARKLPIVAISRDFLAFEDNFTNADGLTRCWITLLPLSSCGSWVDYVYAFVSLEKGSVKAAKAAREAEPPVEEAVAELVEAPAEDAAVEEVETVAEAPAEDLETMDEPPIEIEGPVVAVEEAPADVEEPAAANEPAETSEDVIELAQEAEAVEGSAELEPAGQPEPEAEPAEEISARSGPGFSKILEGFASLTGFYGQGVTVTDPVVDFEPAASEPLPVEEVVEPPLELEEAVVEPELEPTEPPPAEPVAAEPDAEEPLELVELVEPAPAMEGSLQNKLTEVRAKADEARQAALRATAALHEGLSAAYDFALDAESSPEEYFRMVEAQGLKIQLRAPMAPVAKLAFDGLVDPATLGQMEKLLAWALKEELPRGALLERIDQAGGMGELLGEVAKAA